MRYAALAIALLALPSAANAHGYEVGALALHEQAPGDFTIAWRAPEDSRRVTPSRVSIDYPAHCLREHHMLRCGDEGLHGTLAFRDFPDARTPIAVRIERLDGRRIDGVVRADSASLALGPASGARAAIERGARRAFELPHLAVLVGLMLAFGLRRALPALACFIVGHAVALGAGSLISLPSAPLAAMIAVAVLLLAREATRVERAARRTWSVLALLVGLAQGVAASGGSPSMLLPLGALLVDLALLSLFALGASALRSDHPRARVASAYGLGVLGAFWLFTWTDALM